MKLYIYVALCLTSIVTIITFNEHAVTGHVIRLERRQDSINLAKICPLLCSDGAQHGLICDCRSFRPYIKKRSVDDLTDKKSSGASRQIRHQKRKQRQASDRTANN